MKLQACCWQDDAAISCSKSSDTPSKLPKAELIFSGWGEDLGTQIAPIISKETYRKHIRPQHQRFTSLAKSFGIALMVHTCGSSSWVYEDSIEMGVSAVDTLQPEAKDMVLVVWFTWGGVRDIRQLFARLEKAQINPEDDGTVLDHHNAGEPPNTATMQEGAKHK